MGVWKQPEWILSVLMHFYEGLHDFLNCFWNFFDIFDRFWAIFDPIWAIFGTFWDFQKWHVRHSGSCRAFPYPSPPLPELTPPLSTILLIWCRPSPPLTDSRGKKLTGNIYILEIFEFFGPRTGTDPVSSMAATAGLYRIIAITLAIRWVVGWKTAGK